MDKIRRVTREYRASVWAEHIRECRGSGQSIRSWCVEHGVNEKSFYYWQRRFREQACQVLVQDPIPALPSFAEISIEQAKEPEDIAVTLKIGNLTAEIHNGAEATTIEAVVRILKQLC